MIIRNLRSGRRLAVLAIFAIVAVSASGFAAANTVPRDRAGEGKAPSAAIPSQTSTTSSMAPTRR